MQLQNIRTSPYLFYITFIIAILLLFTVTPTLSIILLISFLATFFCGFYKIAIDATQLKDLNTNLLSIKEELEKKNQEVIIHNNEKEKNTEELITAKNIANDFTRKIQYARSLIEASLDPLVTINADGKITDVNEALVIITGISRAKLIGTNFSNYFTEPEKAQEGYRIAFEKGYVSDYALTIKHENRKLTDVLYNASVYKDDDGNVLGVFAAARDVTEQKKVALLSIDNKELAFQNEEKGRRAAELIIANKELDFQNDEKQKRADELTIANKELAFQNDEKQKRADELDIANKELVFQDAEKQKRADELDIANKELAFQNEEKEKRAIELTIANKELSSFTYIASHDLQEPLRKTQLFISRILDDKEQVFTEKNMDYFKRMQVSSKRMQMLINDLLAYSKVNEPDKELIKIDLNDVIDNLLEELTLVQTIEETNTTINYDSLPKIKGIIFQLEQLFTNLITNAIKYSEPTRAPIITIKSVIVKGSEIINEKANPTKKYYKITVSDNGIGFEPEYAEKIFILFQRLHDKQTYSGTGIGLTICKKIAENHNGFITATSVPGQGSTFAVYFPVA